jgi:putative membrane protein
MRASLFGALAAALAMALVPGWAQERTTPQLPPDKQHDFRGLTDGQFVAKAVQINLVEIALGTHAADKARRADVQQFGKELKQDHLKAHHQLELVVMKRFNLASKLDAEHQGKVDKLIALQGDDFDRVYLSEMVVGHRMATALYQHESLNAKDADLKAFATQTLPIVRQHLQKAEQLWTDHFVNKN